MAKHNAIPMVSMSCKGCGSSFTVNGAQAVAYDARDGAVRKFCSQQCYWSSKVPRVDRSETQVSACKICGGDCIRTRRVDSKGRARGWAGPKEFCSASCRATHFNAVRGSGAGFLDKNGYRLVSVNGSAVYEHRVVMERSIGRALRPEETVHHINGDRSDNRVQNLELWSSRHGKGQRVQDKIKFCIEFLGDYGINTHRIYSYDFMSAVMGVG
jgi:hypothetical protein